MNYALGNRLEFLLHVLIMAGCMVRVVEAFHYNPLLYLFSDPLRHWDHARGTLSGAPMVLFDPPLFQIWLSLVQKWSLGAPGLIAAYAAAMSTLTPWLWYRFLRELLSSRLLALAGWACFAWLPSWFAIFSYFMTETLFLPLMGASLWMTLRASRTRTVASFAAMVLLWTLTALTRGIAVPMAGVAGLVVWLGHPSKWRVICVSTAIALILAAPFAYRNQLVAGLWSPFGNPWLNDIYAESGKQEIQLRIKRDGMEWAYGFRSPSLSVKQFEPLTDWSPERSDVVGVDIDLRNGAEDWRAASAASRTRESDFLRLRLENLALVMAGISWPDNNDEHFMARLSMATRWVWAPLFVLLFGVAALRWRATLARPLVPALIVTWFCFQAVSLVAVNEGRYRKPLEGLLIAQALLLLDQTRRRGKALTDALPESSSRRPDGQAQTRRRSPP